MLDAEQQLEFIHYAAHLPSNEYHEFMTALRTVWARAHPGEEVEGEVMLINKALSIIKLHSERMKNGQQPIS
jgi:hypothetical protein